MNLKNNTSNVLSMITACVLAILMLIIVSNNLPQLQTKFLNKWYSDFGLSGLIIDSSLLMINIIVTVYLYFNIYSQYNLTQFILLALGVQLVQSLLLIGLVNITPRGTNKVFDWFKDNRSTMNMTAILEDMGSMALAVLLYTRLHRNKMDTNLMLLAGSILLTQFMIH